MPKVKLTARNVLTLPAGPAGTRETYRDEVLPGLELRVFHSGRRSFRVRYGADGSRAVTLAGDARVLALSVARDQARAILGRVADGEDPAGERAHERRTRATGADTFQSLAAALLQKAQLADTTRRSWTWTLTRRLFPLLGTVPPTALTRGAIREAVDRITARHGTSQGSEALKVVRWVLARAVDADVLAANPAAGIPKVAKMLPRDRVLTVAELRGVWNACEDAGDYGRAVRFAILSGARRGEVFDATRAEIDREGKVWRVPAERMKNRRPHELPLTAAMLEQLVDAKAERLFDCRPTSKAWARVLREAGIIGEEDEDDAVRTRAGRWPVRFHDLRRTFRNALTSELGIPPHVAEALIGHAESGLIRTYAPAGVALADKRRALERWGRHVAAIVAGKAPQKVVTIGDRR